MGWGNCGEDSRGRPIGYYTQAVCDHPGCNEEIDRGLAYACGGMHGEHHMLGEPEELDGCYISCENYFCSKHLYFAISEHEDGAEGPYPPFLCFTCVTEFNRSYREDKEMQALWPTKALPLIVESDYYERITKRIEENE